MAATALHTSAAVPCRALCVAALHLAVVGCGGGGDSSGASVSGPQQATAALGNDVKNVPLVANQPLQKTFTFTVPGTISARGDYTINVAETLKTASLSTTQIVDGGSLIETLRLLASAVIRDAFAADQAQVTAHFSYAGDPNVCNSLYFFGPYTITGAIGAALTGESSSVTPDQPMTNIINRGSFEICVKTTPPITGYLTIQSVKVDFAACEPPAFEVAPSTWSGTYNCTNYGVPNDVNQQVTLSLTRNADGSLHYQDGTASYNGHLCGNKFKFNGGGPNYNESGTMVFASSTSATKTSTWNVIAGVNGGGQCTDTLSRQ